MKASMCGRFTLTASAEALKEVFPLFDGADVRPRYNIAPSQPVLAVRRTTATPRPEFVRLRWGLVPPWAEEVKIGYRLINARAETAADKPAFRSAFRRRRCLILADGFYEWQKLDHGKQPYCIRLSQARPFAFAGLWERWDKDGQSLESCTILTTEANELMRPLHQRMPVILDPADFDNWLDPVPSQPGSLQRLLRPFPSADMIAFPVSTLVNNPANDRPDCQTPLA